MLIILLTGCSNYNELDNLTIIKSIGISYQEKYTLYAEIIDEIDKNNIPKTKIISVESDNISELFQEIEKKVNKEIFFSHIDLILFDFTLKNNNYKEIIQFFLNNSEFRNDFYTIFTEDIQNILQNTKYDEIEKLIQTKEVPKISFEEIISQYINNQEFTLPKITLDKEINFEGIYHYKNNQYERIKNEKD